MIYLADTNILVKYWKAGDDEKRDYEAFFSTNDVIVCGVVRAELVCGSYSEKNRRELHSYLDLFQPLDLESSDWEDLGDQLYEYRIHGVTVPMPDAIIAAIAMKYDLPVWTDDGHFRLMKKAMPNLSIVGTRELLQGTE